MKIEIENPQEGKVILRAKGRLNAETSPDLKAQIREIALQGGLT